MANYIKINNLGSYRDFGTLWSSHPEGGREGDWVTVNGTEYFWDKFLRTWTAGSGSEEGGTTPSVVTNHVDGDLEVSGNLSVGGDADIEGTLTVGDLRLSGGDRYKGQSTYKSIVFCRGANKPNKPGANEGSYADPVPTGWHDGIPNGTDPIWTTSRIFTSDNKAPREAEWHDVQLMADTQGFDVEFSPYTTNQVPPPPNGANQSGSGQIWFDPVTDRNNPNANWSQMNWMAERHKDAGSSQWSEWTIMLIKGEQGEGYQHVYRVSATNPERYSGSYPPAAGSGWHADFENLVVTDDFALWMCERRFANGSWGAWSDAIRISGPDGKPGADGSNIEFVYKPSNRLPATDGSDRPTGTSSSPGLIPDGWYNHPMGVGDITIDGVTDFYKYEWMCQRTKSPGDTMWSEWSNVIVWSAYGDKGRDGDGVEYVFIRTNKKVNPGIVETYEDSNSNDPYDDEFLPRADLSKAEAAETEDVNENETYEYTDNPQGVCSTYSFEWVAKRRQLNGVWQAFGTPALWATYSEGHTIEISDDGYWKIDGEYILVNEERVKAEGQDGTGVQIKDTVDYYSAADATNDPANVGSNPRSLEGVTGDQNITLNPGDCYVVDYVDVSAQSSADWVRGHLFVYRDVTRSNWEDAWKDLGPFRGHGTWMHIAWCSNIVYKKVSGEIQYDANGKPVVNIPLSGQLVLVKGAENYAWMGICINDQPEDPTAHNAYEWTYLKGQDGLDVEYVYLRTKIETAPKITESADQNPEREPYVGNTEDFVFSGNNQNIERDRFFDDPQGVEEEWPYEWMSKREKVNGVWRTFMTPAKLWATYSKPGESAVTIKAYPPLFTVNTPSNGQLSSQQTLTLECRLFDGNTEVEQTLTTGWGLSYSNSSQVTISNASVVNGAIRWTITVKANAALTDGILTVTKTHNGKTLTELVPVSVVADGAEGRKVTQVDTYYLLTTMYQGVSVNTQGWMANTYQEPTELLPYLWRYTKYTFSTGSPTTTPCELIAVYSSKSNPNLLADTGFISSQHMSAWRKKGHLEITNPSNPTVLDVTSGFSIASNIQKDGHNSYRGYERSDDPKQDDYISLLVQDVYYPSHGIARVLPSTWYTLSFWIKSVSYYAANTKLDVKMSGGYTADGTHTSLQLIDWAQPVYVDGVAMATRSYDLRFQAEDDWKKHTITFKTTDEFAPQGDTEGNIRFSLRFQMSIKTVWQELFVCMPKLEAGLVATPYMEMLDSLNPTPRTSVWAPGKQYYQGMTGEPYLDIVSYGNAWYRCLLTHVSTNDITPSNAGYWQPAADYRFVATDLILADRGVINLLASNVINLFDVSRNKTASINEDGHGSYCIYYSNGRKKMEFCYDGYIYYYKNEEGSPWKWRLGYGGDILTGNEDDMQPIYLTKLTSGLSTVFGSSTTWGQREYWQFHAGHDSVNIQHNGKIYTQEFNPVSDDLVDNYLIEGGYYTPDAAPKKVNLMYMTLVYEVAGGRIVGKYNLYSDGSDASNNISRPITDTEEEDSANSGSSSGSGGGVGEPTNPGGGGTNQGGNIG